MSFCKTCGQDDTYAVQTKLRVISYDSVLMHHECEDASGFRVRVDLTIDGTLRQYTNEELCGKTVVCDYLHASYLKIAANPRVIEGEE